jgi:hypothetical protein
MRAGASFEAVQYSAGPDVGFSTTTYQSAEREHSRLRMRTVIGELLISIRLQEVRHEKTSPRIAVQLWCPSQPLNTSSLILPAPKQCKFSPTFSLPKPIIRQPDFDEHGLT